MSALAIQTSKGSVRNKNQDAACVLLARTKGGEVGMVVVCDGVGGLACGEVASATVTDAFNTWFCSELPALLDHAGKMPDHLVLKASWSSLLLRTNTLLHERGLTQGAPMGTTCTTLLVWDGAYAIAHVGDSRAYVLGDDGIRQLTEDQTLAALAQKRGMDDARMQVDAPHAHAILQAVGAADILEPTFFHGEHGSHSIFVVCSDGAYRTMGASGLHEAFLGVDTHDSKGLDAVCKQIVDMCMERGEHDNITLACLELCSSTDADETVVEGRGRR